MMDGPLGEAEHHAALAGLERLNVLAFSVRPFWQEIRPLAAASPRPLRVVDVACGGGGLVAGLRRAAHRAGISLEVDGCDRSPTAVAFAEARAPHYPKATGRFFVQDILAEGVPAGYDVVVNSLFLHHLSEADATAFLADAAAKATRLLLLSDILRTRLGWWMVRLACTTLGGSRVVVEDGQTSLRAAFTTAELQALARSAGLPHASFRRHWPERVLLRVCAGYPPAH